MTSLLVRNAALLVAMDEAGSRWEDGGIYVIENVIQQLGPSGTLPSEADQVIDARGMLIMPGMVNTHHHFSQTLTRSLPESVPVAPDTLSRLGRVDAGGHLHERQDRDSRADAFGLHNVQRSHIRLAQRRPHRQRNPGCCRDGIPLSRGSGLYVLGRVAGGPAAGRAG